MHLLRPIVAALLLPAYFFVSVDAAQLDATDGVANDALGHSVSLSGDTALAGSYVDNVGVISDQGSAFVFRGLNGASGTVTQNVKLLASDGAGLDYFGRAVSLSGNTALVGVHQDDVDANSNQGSAYIFRGLDTASGTVTQNVKLLASDGAASDQFGRSVSLAGSTALVGSYLANINANNDQGAAYVFRGMDTASGTATENVKLVASDGEALGYFGYAVSLSGNTAVVGSYRSDVTYGDQGAAYVFRGLDSASGTVTENAKLTASDGDLSDNFGFSASVSGNTAVLGAYRDDVGTNIDQGSAYVFRGLDSVSGAVTEHAKLVASDGAIADNFGYSVSVSGNTALVGAYFDDVGANSNQGSVYVFRNLDTATGTVTEDVKLTASGGAALNAFGVSVALDGDLFVIGADGANSSRGRAYTGRISSVTTQDVGGVTRTIDGISFASQSDWEIGVASDLNQMTLLAGNTANVQASGKAVYIGRNAGSDSNILAIAGTLQANTIYIGSIDGNTDNYLVLESGAAFSPVDLRLAGGNYLKIAGDQSNSTNLLAYLGSSYLQVWDSSMWMDITVLNFDTLLSTSFTDGYTTFTYTAVPEPSTYAMLVTGLVVLGFVLRRRLR